MNMLAATGVFVGAGIGALLRWALGIAFNHAFPQLPPSTLAANVLGATIMGVLIAVFAANDTLSPVLRLTLTTGFLGGLTTFSAFTAESMSLLLQGDVRWAAIHGFAHVALSLASAFGGFALGRWILVTAGA